MRTIATPAGPRPLTDEESLAYRCEAKWRELYRLWDGLINPARPTSRVVRASKEHDSLTAALRARVGSVRADELLEWVNEHWREIQESHESATRNADGAESHHPPRAVAAPPLRVALVTPGCAASGKDGTALSSTPTGHQRP